MNNDIIKPKKPEPSRSPATPSEPQDIRLPDVVPLPPPAREPGPSGPNRKRWAIGGLVAAVVVALIVVVSGWLWYQSQLQAVAPGSGEMVKISIAPGADTSGIAEQLKENDLIRSEAAFLWYVRFEGVSGLLQSGTYRLAKADDVPTIVEHITSGKTDTFSITFLPGDTLAKHRQVLIDAGYRESAVDEALTKRYSGSLFSGKPASADLEGYIYGETYNFPASATPEQILQRTFDEFQTVVDEYDLVAAYKKRGFTLYEGITLASIIQKEEREYENQQKVAQVFLLRLKKDMPLGSDPTYQYAADKLGIPRDTALDSPYNTRKVPGLPPGPIASPGEGALRAVAEPARGDYLYFLSGDDDKLYFGRTLEEHERNIQEHCQKKCQIL